MKNKVVAIYIRTNKNDDEILNTQEKILRITCNNKNYKIYKVYSDKGCSGRTLVNRSGFSQMMKDLKNKKFNTIMVCNISRISRNLLICNNFMKEIEKYKCDIETPINNFTEEYKKLLERNRKLEILREKNIFCYCRVGTLEQTEK